MQKSVKTRTIGNTDLRVTQLGLGGAPLGNLFQPVSDEEATNTIMGAIDAGLNYFDTAPFYGFGLSERRMGDQLRKLDRKDFVLSTKAGRVLDPAPDVDTNSLRHGFASPMPFEPRYDYSYDGIMRSYEESLQRLGLASIDILLAHDIGRMTHGDNNESHFKDLVEGGYKALDELRSCGAIKAIGLGVNEWEVCDEVMNYGQFDAFLLAGRYTLLDQVALDNFLPKCEKHGASIILGGVYNSGILAIGTKTDAALTYNYEAAPADIIEKVRKIETVCDAHNVPLAAAALQFPMAHPIVSSVIPGVDTAERFHQALALYDQTIPASLWRDLKNENLLADHAPVPA